MGKWVFHNADDDSDVNYIECVRDNDGVVLAREPQTCSDDGLFKLPSQNGDNKDKKYTVLTGDWDSVWKIDDKSNYYYRKSTKKWIELDNNKYINQYKEMNSSSDSVVLYAYNRIHNENFYLKLSVSYAWGFSFQNMNNTIATGEWINKNKNSYTV